MRQKPKRERDRGDWRHRWKKQRQGEMGARGNRKDWEGWQGEPEAGKERGRVRNSDEWKWRQRETDTRRKRDREIQMQRDEQVERQSQEKEGQQETETWRNSCVVRQRRGDILECTSEGGNTSVTEP